MLSIRRFKPTEEKTLWNVFHHTVHHINSRDYNSQQIQAWSPPAYDAYYWVTRMHKINPFVVLLDQQIVAYADIQDNGYITHFFCHHLHQGKGIGKTLLNHLMTIAKQNNLTTIQTDASETARPFFIKCGFEQLQVKSAQIRGQSLTNYLLEMKME